MKTFPTSLLYRAEVRNLKKKKIHILLAVQRQLNTSVNAQQSHYEHPSAAEEEHDGASFTRGPGNGLAGELEHDPSQGTLRGQSCFDQALCVEHQRGFMHSSE